MLIYELLHGETPFSSCRTEKELKQALSVPIAKKKIRHDLSPDVREAIMECLTIDEAKRPTMKDIISLPYFKRIMGVEQPKLPLQTNHGAHGSALDLRIRSPSHADNKMLRSEQPEFKRKVSADRQMVVPGSLQKQQSEQTAKTTPFLNHAHHLPKVHHRPADSREESLRRDRRAMSTEKLTLLSGTGGIERSINPSSKGEPVTNF